MKWLCLVAGALLLIAIPSGLPYSYYSFLRLFIFVSSFALAYRYYQSKLVAWAIIFGAIGILFNPLSPFYMPKSSWVSIDFISAILFIVAAFSVTDNNVKS